MPLVSSQMLGPTSFLSSVIHGGASGDGVEARAAEEGGPEAWSTAHVNSFMIFILLMSSVSCKDGPLVMDF